jgi:CheY-like chemotaxis protein
MDTQPHILIVEDSTIAQIILKKQLIDQGCTVDVTSDGPSALEQAMTTFYDLILMDIGLGDGPDGFETSLLIKRQSEINADTPIIAITAHDDHQYKQKAISIGMVDYFIKPFTLENAKKIIDLLKNTH